MHSINNNLNTEYKHTFSCQRCTSLYTDNTASFLPSSLYQWIYRITALYKSFRLSRKFSIFVSEMLETTLCRSFLASTVVKCNTISIWSNGRDSSIFFANLAKDLRNFYIRQPKLIKCPSNHWPCTINDHKHKSRTPPGKFTYECEWLTDDCSLPASPPLPLMFYQKQNWN